MIINPPPPAPSRADDGPAFAAKADALVAALPTFVAQANLLAGLSNFRGMWSALSGQLQVPAAVGHIGSVWLLDETVADVTAHEPGVSAVWVPVPRLADAGDFAAGVASRLIDAALVYDANVPLASSGSGTVTLDFTERRVFQHTATGNITLANPANQRAGQSGVIYIVQDATGGRTVSFGSDWKRFVGGGLISTAADAVNVFSYLVREPGAVTLSYLGPEE